jgi:hypothetical protein
MATFQVYNQRSGKVLLETDDWVEAEQRALGRKWPNSQTPIYIRGTHPTHDWSGPRKHGGTTMVRTCAKCGGYDNGSYGSHAPCGYDFDGEGGSSLMAALEREMAARTDP